jgi:hypothetical protein
MAAIDPSDNCALNLDHLGIVSAVSKDLGPYVTGIS